MSLKMYAQYKVLKKNEKTNEYEYLTCKHHEELPFPGPFGFVINGDRIPFDFYESTTVISEDGTVESIMRKGQVLDEDLIEGYDNIYASIGLTRKDLTPEFLASASHIYEFYLNFEDVYGDEFDSVTFEDNTGNESLFKVELLSVSFIDEEEKECAIRQEVLDKYNGKCETPSKMYPDNKPGDIIDMAVYDCFEGKVKILQQEKDSVFIEIVDVCMCYPSQKQALPGERCWVDKEEIFNYPNL